MPLSNSGQLVAPLWVINQRLLHWTQPGRFLDGINYFQDNRTRQETVDTLPSLTWRGLVTGRDVGRVVGAPKDSQQGAERKNTPIGYQMLLTLELATLQENLFVREFPEDPEAPLGHYDWIARVMDAIETSTTDIVDSALEGTLFKPVSIDIVQSESSELTIVSDIQVTLLVRTFCRGEAHYDYPHA